MQPFTNDKQFINETAPEQVVHRTNLNEMYYYKKLYRNI